jgi:hypothetical protein
MSLFRLHRESPRAQTGRVVLGLAVLTLTGRSPLNLQATIALAGFWLIISPFILGAKFPITASMYWSNVWGGAIILVLALGALALNRPDTAR